MDEFQNVRVSVRLRPLSGKEKLDGCTNCLEAVTGNKILVLPDKSFSFDYVFNPSTTQEEIFNVCAVPVLQNFLAGYNATIIAYGQVR